MNRFNYLYGVFIYILASSKSDRKQFILVFLLLILAYLRAGLGVFMYLGMIFYLKYATEILYFIRKRFLIFLIVLIIFPTVVSLLYSIRTELRGGDKETSSSDPIFGVLVGRLSSFSDSGFILQELPYFFLNAQQLDLFYFQKQALSVFSQNFMPIKRPEIMLYKFYYEDSDANVAYMAGTQGNLYISLMRSPISLLLNLLTIFAYIYCTFYLFRLLRFKYSTELALILLLYVLMSGVSNEFAFIIFSVAVFLILFLVVNFLKSTKIQLT